MVDVKKTLNQSRLRFLTLFCLGFLFAYTGCGRKAAPVPPRTISPPPVLDLKAEVAGDAVRLTWSVPTKDNRVFPDIEGFRVLRHRSHSSEDTCSGCPLPFDTFLDILFDVPEPATIDGGRVSCDDVLQPGYRHAYKVVVVHQSGGTSSESNVVEVE